MNEPQVKYIGHSGFSVELGKVVLLFDYYQGRIPDFASDAKIYVFSSHRHQDHFNFAIFELWSRYETVSFILSNDITKKYKQKYLQEKKGLSEECIRKITGLGPEAVFEDENILVRTIPSTDIGVAFIVKEKKSGQVIYHAGDLNWWTWEGETSEQYVRMTKAFQDNVKQLEDYPVDIAFLPLDPRQGDRFFLGFDYVMKHVKIEKAYPMHCWDDFSVIEKLRQMECSKEYREKIMEADKA